MDEARSYRYGRRKQSCGCQVKNVEGALLGLLNHFLHCGAGGVE